MTDTARKDIAVIPAILPDNLLPIIYVANKVPISAIADIHLAIILMSCSVNSSMPLTKPSIIFSKYNGKLPYANHLGFKLL